MPRGPVSHHRRTVMARALPLDSARIVMWNIAAKYTWRGDPMAEASVVAAPGAHVADKSNQAILAAAIGNLLEWYDFGVYAYLAGLIATKFFPSSLAARRLRGLWRRLPGAAARRHRDRPPRRHQRPQDGAGAHHLPDGVRHGRPRP